MSSQHRGRDMQQQMIRDATGNPIGYVIEQQNGDQKLYNMTTRYLGYYSKMMNRTYNPSGGLVTMGNTLIMLLR